jgi:hypothetical protein
MKKEVSPTAPSSSKNGKIKQPLLKKSSLGTDLANFY